jgi:nitroreductase
MDEPSFFEIINTTKSVRRLKRDRVPLNVIRKVLDAGIKAPSGENTQPWEFVVVTNKEDKNFIKERYNSFVKLRFAKRFESIKDNKSPYARMLEDILHLAENLHHAPLLLLVCGHRDWPYYIPSERRIGKAPPPYASIYPCVQNILLACRAFGLGATLTTIHHMFEDELYQRFNISYDVAIVALIPIGYPEGTFGRVKRRPVEEVTHFERWENRNPLLHQFKMKGE